MIIRKEVYQSPYLATWTAGGEAITTNNNKNISGKMAVQQLNTYLQCNDERKQNYK